MRTKGIWITLIAVMVLSLVIAAFGCSVPTTPTPTPTAKPAPTTTAPAPAPTASTPGATAAPAKITLKVGITTAEAGGSGAAVRFYMDTLEQFSGGRIKCEPYWSYSLLKSGFQIAELGKATADLAWVSVDPEIDRLPLTSIYALPGLSGHPIAISTAFNEIAKEAAIQAEFTKANIKFLVMNNTEVSNVGSTKKTVKLEDLKGQNLWATGDKAKAAARLGANPQSFSAAEQYDAIIKGVIDGSVVPLGSATRGTYRTAEWAKYYYGVPLGAPAWIWFANNDSFNKLPKDIQDFLQSPRMTSLYNETWNRLAVLGDSYDGLLLFQKNNNTITNPTADEMAKITTLLAPMYDDWRANNDKKGLPGTDIYNKYMAALKKAESFYTYPRQ